MKSKISIFYYVKLNLKSLPKNFFRIQTNIIELTIKRLKKFQALRRKISLVILTFNIKYSDKLIQYH